MIIFLSLYIFFLSSSSSHSQRFPLDPRPANNISTPQNAPTANVPKEAVSGANLSERFFHFIDKSKKHGIIYATTVSVFFDFFGKYFFF